jgi:uncharacterized delta-60 repeat protein
MKKPFFKDLLMKVLLLIPTLTLSILTNNAVGQAAGSLDTSFGGDGKVTTLITPEGLWGPSPSLLQPDGKIVMAMALVNEPNLATITTARYLPNGELDKEWGLNGIAVTGISSSKLLGALDIAIQPDGKILIAGFRDTVVSPTVTLVSPFILRYLSTGVLDPGFGNNGVVLPTGLNHGRFTGIAVVGSRIFTCGITSGGLLLGAFNISDGSLDQSWGNGGYVTHTGLSYGAFPHLLIQSDQKLLVSAHSYLFRYLPDGQIDSSFGSNDGYLQVSEARGMYGSSFFPMALQPDGKILIAGNTSSSLTFGAVERYDMNGALDTTFANQGVFHVDFLKGKSDVTTIGLQSDGKVLVGGHAIDTGSGDIMFALARYKADGVPDSVFGTNGLVTTSFHPNDSVDIGLGMLIQPDGKILMTGHSVLHSIAVGGIPFNTLTLARYHPGQINNVSTPIAKKSSFIIYPNPARELLHVDYKLHNTESVQVDLYDLQGRHVSELLKTVKPSGSHKEIFILPAGVVPGTYLLKVRLGQQDNYGLVSIE